MQHRFIKLHLYTICKDFPGGSDDKASVYSVGDLGSIPGSERFPGRRKWQPTPVFLPRKSHGQRSLVHGVAKSKELDTHY